MGTRPGHAFPPRSGPGASLQRVSGVADLPRAAKALARGGIVVRNGSAIVAAAAAERTVAAGAAATSVFGRGATTIDLLVDVGAATAVAIIAIECIECDDDDDEGFDGVVVSFSTTENFRIMSLSSCDMMWQCQM